MHFVGKKVVIRAIEREDLAFLRDLHNAPDVARTIEFAWPLSMAHQERFYERTITDGTTKRLVIEASGQGPIGYTGIWGIDWVDRRATNGIILGSKFRGQGYATDAIMTVARVAFDDVGLHRLDAEIYEFNEASVALYTRHCGWREEGRRREHVFRNGRFWDRILVGITATEYRAFCEERGYWKT